MQEVIRVRCVSLDGFAVPVPDVLARLLDFGRGNRVERREMACAELLEVDDADPAISHAAIKALTLVGDGSSVAVLVKAAAQGEEANRAAAMQALEQINTPDVSKALLAQLEDADATETAVLAKVMGQRRDKAALDEPRHH